MLIQIKIKLDEPGCFTLSGDAAMNILPCDDLKTQNVSRKKLLEEHTAY